MKKQKPLILFSDSVDLAAEAWGPGLADEPIHAYRWDEPSEGFFSQDFGPLYGEGVVIAGREDSEVTLMKSTVSQIVDKAIELFDPNTKGVTAWIELTVRHLIRKTQIRTGRRGPWAVIQLPISFWVMAIVRGEFICKKMKLNVSRIRGGEFQHSVKAVTVETLASAEEMGVFHASR